MTPAERRSLASQAHHLSPVVLLGSNGLTPAVMQEIDRALTSHELIKIRLTGAERDDRKGLAAQITDTLSCAAVQQIGLVLVLYRQRPPEEPPAPARPRAAAAKPSAAPARSRTTGRAQR